MPHDYYPNLRNPLQFKQAEFSLNQYNNGKMTCQNNKNHQNFCTTMEFPEFPSKKLSYSFLTHDTFILQPGYLVLLHLPHLFLSPFPIHLLWQPHVCSSMTMMRLILLDDLQMDLQVVSKEEFQKSFQQWQDRQKTKLKIHEVTNWKDNILMHKESYF